MTIDVTIDIKWRLRDFLDCLVIETIDDMYLAIVDGINNAKKSGDYSKPIESIGEIVGLVEDVLGVSTSADRIKLVDAVKGFISSLYRHCPELKKAVERDGSIDSGYLP